MAVLISNRQDSHKLPLEKVRQKAQAILNALDSSEAELSILIVDDPRIAELNHRYLQRTGATNVIAFPMREGSCGQIAPYLLGDVVISADTAAREGALGGAGFENRFDELLVHGILHLCGYDHENDGEQAREMETKSRELLLMLNTAPTASDDPPSS